LIPLFFNSPSSPADANGGSGAGLVFFAHNVIIHLQKTMVKLRNANASDYLLCFLGDLKKGLPVRMLIAPAAPFMFDFFPRLRFNKNVSGGPGLEIIEIVYRDLNYWTCSITRLVIEQVLQNAPHFAVF
jgi:hypothetical protein